MGNKGRRADLTSPAMSRKAATIVFPDAEKTSRQLQHAEPGYTFVTRDHSSWYKCPMKRTAGEYAILLELLDQALDLPHDARAEWLERLAAPHVELRSTLRRMLETAPDRETSDLNLPQRIASLARDAAATTNAKPLASGDQVGPYELTRELGRGGMGSVWLASRRDGAFKRSVALKLPHISWVGGLADRMIRERDILAGLEHPNIARLYDAGVDALGRPFMALEYVEGVAIDVYCREQSLTLRQRLGLVLEVAKAVAYAHSKLVIHRDLKPGNILVTKTGEVRLLDFGIAKLIASDADHDARLTQFAGRLLTPDYASPEQIKGETVGTQADVYSLAVVTYELLSETRPYKLKRGTPAELEQAITIVDALPASEAAADTVRKRELRGDLDAILNKALKKNPAERYPTIDAFAGDLQRHLDGEVVLARPDSAVYRLRKFIGRNRLGFGAATAILLALVAATVFSTLQAREARHQAETANAIKNFMLKVIAAGDNETAGSKPAADMTAIELIDKSYGELRTSMKTQPAVKLELLATVGDVYQRLDATDKALEVFREGVRIAEATYGPHSVQKAEMLARIANALTYAGRFPQAEPAVAEAEKEMDASGSHASLAYAMLLKDKGNLLRRKGPASALLAESTLQRAAALFKKDFPDSGGYVGTLMFLAGAQQLLDDMQGAKSSADTAVMIAREQSVNVLNIANALSMRASLEDELGDYAGAQRDYAESSALYADSAGAKDFLYLQNENFRGQSLHLTGQRDAGLRLLESTTAQVAEVRANSNTLANCLARLADAYLRDGAFGEAERRIEQALAIPAALHNQSLHTHLLLAQARAQTGLGRFAEARDTAAAALQAASADGPPSRYLTGEMELALGTAALAGGDLNDSERHLNLARAASVGETRRLRHLRARIEGTTARLAAVRGDSESASSAAADARQISESADIRSDLFVRAEVMAAIGEALCSPASSASSAAGLTAATEALTTRTAIQRAGSPLIAESQIDLAACLLNSGNRDQVENLLASAQAAVDTDPSVGPQFRAALDSVKSRYRGSDQ